MTPWDTGRRVVVSLLPGGVGLHVGVPLFSITFAVMVEVEVASASNSVGLAVTVMENTDVNLTSHVAYASPAVAVIVELHECSGARSVTEAMPFASVGAWAARSSAHVAANAATKDTTEPNRTWERWETCAHTICKRSRLREMVLPSV